MKRQRRGNVQSWNPKHGELNTAAQQDRQMLKHLQGHSHRPNNEKNKKHYDSESNLLPTLENAFLSTIFSLQIRNKHVFSDCYSAGFHIHIWTIAIKGEEELPRSL